MRRFPAGLTFAEKCALVLATVGGAGYVPYAQGTFASAFVVATALVFPNSVWVLPVFVVSSLLAFWACAPASRALGKIDPQEFVLDEVAGMALSLLFLPLDPANVLIAFGFFRFFDTLKPLGVRRLERIPHPTAILWDDLLAGVYANLATRLSAAVFMLFFR